MTREEKLKKIKETVGSTIVEIPGTNESFDIGVMIGNILDWIDINCNWIETDNGNSRHIEEHKLTIFRINYLFVGKHSKSLGEQDDNCIDAIFELVNDSSL